MIEVDCAMWRRKGEIRVEFQAWDAGGRFSPYPSGHQDWSTSAESLLPPPNKLSRRGLMFHVRVTFDPLNRPAWRQPTWQLAAAAPWRDVNNGVPLALRSDA